MNRAGILIVMLLTFFVASLAAAQTGDSTAYAFKGHLKQGKLPCTLNGGDVIEVPFGNVDIRKVGSGEYLENINYTLDCGSANSSNEVSFFLYATPTTWDAHAMAASAQGLGVLILNKGTPIDLNIDIPVELDNLPELQAQLVTDGKTDMTAQAFTAEGTLVGAYQ
ncbi:fimbrial protein [Erwinia billingiae]|uniref:fimbrial protein n=1 Tax=Erwinia billingiae TaxID=182337 RepID=UPI0032083A30